jgi:Outer membrane protein beta-barrel domain
MRYFKCLLASLVCMASFVSTAQTMYQSFSFGVGQFTHNSISVAKYPEWFGDDTVSQISHFSPQFTATYEVKLDKKMAIDFKLRYVTIKSDREEIDGPSFFAIWPSPRDTNSFKVHAQALGGDMAFKGSIYATDKLDMYVRVGVGGFIARERIKFPLVLGSGKFDFTQYRIWLSYDIKAGIQYFPLKQYGIFGEFGYSRIGRPTDWNWNSGVIYRF